MKKKKIKTMAEEVRELDACMEAGGTHEECTSKNPPSKHELLRRLIRKVVPEALRK